MSECKLPVAQKMALELRHKAPIMQSSGTPISKRFRVIDVYERSIRIAPEDCHYVALYYLWGDQSASHSHPVASQLSSKLPLTIEDSIKATQMPGYKYL